MNRFEPQAESSRVFESCQCKEDVQDIEKCFCYAEGSEQVRNLSDSKIEMTENIWYDIKPPRLYTKEFFPLVTARQVYVTRVLLDGKKAVIEGAEEVSSGKKEKINISMNKKKSAVRFLSNVRLA